jgi:hypothetical protein
MIFIGYYENVACSGTVLWTKPTLKWLQLYGGLDKSFLTFSCRQISEPMHRLGNAASRDLLIVLLVQIFISVDATGSSVKTLSFFSDS